MDIHLTMVRCCDGTLVDTPARRDFSALLPLACPTTPGRTR